MSTTQLSERGVGIKELRPGHAECSYCNSKLDIHRSLKSMFASKKTEQGFRIIKFQSS